MYLFDPLPPPFSTHLSTFIPGYTTSSKRMMRRPSRELPANAATPPGWFNRDPYFMAYEIIPI